jgi:hypothetical protein
MLIYPGSDHVARLPGGKFDPEMPSIPADPPQKGKKGPIPLGKPGKPY